MDWFPAPATRGRWYAVLATSQNAGAAIAPALLTALVTQMGGGGTVGGVQVGAAERVLFVVAALAGVCALLIAAGVQDKAAVGAPAPAAVTPAKAASAQPSPAGPGLDGSAGEKVWAVLTCWPLWLLGANYFFNSFLRNAFTEVPDFLLGAVDARTKVLALSTYEAAAAVGGFAAGFLSDRVFGGRRGPVMALASAAATAIPLVMLSSAAAAGGIDASGQIQPWLPYPVLYGALGVTAFAPHVLNGLAAREVAPVGTTATAGGFAKSLGQLGGALAGWPFVAACNMAGVNNVTFRWWVLTAACLAAIATAVPLWHVLPLPGGVAAAVVERLKLSHTVLAAESPPAAGAHASHGAGNLSRGEGPGVSARAARARRRDAGNHQHAAAGDRASSGSRSGDGNGARR